MQAEPHFLRHLLHKNHVAETAPLWLLFVMGELSYWLIECNSLFFSPSFHSLIIAPAEDKTNNPEPKGAGFLPILPSAWTTPKGSWLLFSFLQRNVKTKTLLRELCGPPLGDSNFPASALTQNFNLISNCSSPAILSSLLSFPLLSLQYCLTTLLKSYPAPCYLCYVKRGPTVNFKDLGI